MRRRGLGSINVGPLAQAQFSGQLGESYETGLMYQPVYTSTPQPWPRNQASQSFAAQVASLLGGSAAQVPGSQVDNLPGSDYPSVWVVNLPGGVVDPAQLFPQGVILSYPDECAVENALVGSIPGGALSPACAGGGSGMTPTQLAVSQGATIPVTPSGQSTIVGYTPPAPAAQPPAAAPPAAASKTSTQGRAGNAPPAPSNIVTGTAGASVAPAGGAAAPSGDLVIGGWDVSQAASGVPWWGWAIAAGLVLMVATSGGRR